MAEKNKYNIVKAASWYTIGNILVKGVSFFVLPIFTRLMSTHEYGIYSVYISYLTIFEVMILFGLSATVNIAKYSKELDFEAYMSTAITVPMVLAVLSAIGINSYLVFGGTLLSMGPALWNCLLLTASFGAVAGIVGARLVVDGKYKLYMVYSSLHIIGNVAISLILCFTVYAEHDIHMARVWGQAGSTVISAVFLMAVTHTGFKIHKEYIRYAFAWGIPLLFHTVATVVLTQSDRVLIRYMMSYSSAGIYAVATTLSSIPMTIQSSLTQAWTPWFYDKLSKKEYGLIIKLNNLYIILYASMIAGFILISPELIAVFTDKEYWGSIYSLVPLSISAFGEMLYSLPVNIEYYHKKATYIMAGTLSAVCINIGLDILFIIWFGYSGAAYATALSKLCLFLMHCHFAKKIDRNKIFSKDIVVIAYGALAVVNVIVIIFTGMSWLRYALAVFLIAGIGHYIRKNKAVLRAYIQNV